jgi:hypothetical protein
VTFSLRNATSRNAKQVATSVLVNALITSAFVGLDRRFLHWFILPTTICGCTCLVFLLRAVRQGRSFTDPSLLISALGYHNTYVAPMLHVYWDYRILALSIQPDDYRPWFGRMACVNLLGIAIFVVVFSHVVNRGERVGRQTIWVVARKRLMVCGLLVILTSVALQAFVYADFGGVGGYVDQYLHEREAWNNKGWLLVIAESAPLVGVLIMGALRKERVRRTPLPLLMVFGCAFVILQILFGGLRGSRSNIVVNCFFAAGIVDQVFRPLSKKLVLLLGIAVVAFSYFYAFFKDFGFEGVETALSSEGREFLARQSGRSAETVLLSDLSRADIQAFVLQEFESGRQVDLALGRTYVGALSLLVPRVIWPERLPTKLKWTTELENGEGSYANGVGRSTRMYGQVGEAMLNFGYWGVPIPFTVMALVIGKISVMSRRMAVMDARRMLLPGLVIVSLCMVIQDSDNILYFLVQYLSIPWAIIWISTTRGAADYAFSNTALTTVAAR